MNKEGDSAYTQATTSGYCEHNSGLIGKYDNLRKYWEVEITRMFLLPYFDLLVKSCISKNKNIRILDIGCGSGDGFEILMNMYHKNNRIHENDIFIIKPENLDLYKGIDLNDSLLEKAKIRFKNNDKTEFDKADISKGLPVGEGEKPYDIYFTSFGTFSHLHDNEAICLLSDIAKHADDNALIVGDWLGRYSYEWQNLWDTDTSREKWIDYRHSYIYPEDERKSVDVEILPLRLMCRKEIENVVKQAENRSGVNIIIKNIFDRSIVCGRHMDTGEYNMNKSPMRRVLNSLFENSQRTNIESLLFKYKPIEGFDYLNDFFRNFQTEWNLIISFVLKTFSGLENKIESFENKRDILSYYPTNVQKAIKVFKRAINISEFIEYGDSRATILELQLGYILRNLEVSHQCGNGYGHGIIGIFEVKKK